MKNLELAVKEVAKEMYKQGILKAPITQKGQLDLIAKVTKIENDIIEKYNVK